jgi:hypothetical protein
MSVDLSQIEQAAYFRNALRDEIETTTLSALWAGTRFRPPVEDVVP